MCHPQSGRRVLSVCPSSRFAFVFLWFRFGYGWVASCKDDTPTEWCENQRVTRFPPRTNWKTNPKTNNCGKLCWQREFWQGHFQIQNYRTNYLVGVVVVNISASRQTLHWWYSSVVLQLELLTGTHTKIAIVVVVHVEKCGSARNKSLTHSSIAQHLCMVTSMIMCLAIYRWHIFRGTFGITK